MSVIRLNDKIRKTKNPSVIYFEADAGLIPPHIREDCGDFASAYERFCFELLEGLKGTVPAVRFGLGGFSVLGADGTALLSRCLKKAKACGYYVLLDLPEMLTSTACALAVEAIEQKSIYDVDGVVVGAYLGSDMLQPLKQLCKNGTAVFVVVRTANRSSVEVQDLMTGGRLVHTAVADIVWRCGESQMTKCGYSQMGIVAAASSSDSIRTLRSKYSGMFFLLDGYDYPNANAKNCSFAFDKFGHGAIACAAASVTAAWREDASACEDYVTLAVTAAERMRKNLSRYIQIL